MMIKRCVAVCAALALLAGCSSTAQESATAPSDAANLAREVGQGDGDPLPTALSLAEDGVVPDDSREGETGVDELLEQSDSLPVLDGDESFDDPYNGLDIAEGDIGVETADFSFEARDLPAGISGVGESISVPIDSIVSFALVTDQVGELLIEEIGASAQTNGDAAQVVFVADEVGLFPIVLDVDGNERVITTLIVDNG